MVFTFIRCCEYSRIAEVLFWRGLFNYSVLVLLYLVYPEWYDENLLQAVSGRTQTSKLITAFKTESRDYETIWADFHTDLCRIMWPLRKCVSNNLPRKDSLQVRLTQNHCRGCAALLLWNGQGVNKKRADAQIVKDVLHRMWNRWLNVCMWSSAWQVWQLRLMFTVC